MSLLRLVSAESLDGLSETHLLPSAEAQVATGFTKFPLSSAECVSIDVRPRTEALPRVSLFSSDQVMINGFRLFERESKFFNDVSLTALDLDWENSATAHKFSIGQTEDVNFSSLGKRDVGSFREVSRDGPILLPCSDEPSNFGSWIYRFVPKLILSKKSQEYSAILVYQQPWMKRLIDLIGFNAEIIPHDPRMRYLVKSPCIPSIPAPYVFLRREITDLMQDLHQQNTERVSLGEKIYISRRDRAIENPLGRVFENETGLMARLSLLGFREFFPEKYSFEHQLSILDHAKIIVGCGGSNMFGTVFARNAELIVDIESSSEWLHAHINLMASTSARWSIVCGAQNTRGEAPHHNWQLDLDTFCQGLPMLM